jgi:4-aminobutyrate aminotransferase-like enzyme
VRGIGPMVAIELAEQTSDETARITAAAREQGLMLLSCGIYGNVIRILVPFTIGDAELERGLDILEKTVRRRLDGAGQGAQVPASPAPERAHGG